ncbi:MAG: hypothetical protein RIC36_01070 [Rhodospirillales bacterium]
MSKAKTRKPLVICCLFLLADTKVLLRADLPLLSASPLETPDAYDSINSVILNVKVHRRDLLSAKSAGFPVPEKPGD